MYILTNLLNIRLALEKKNIIHHTQIGCTEKHRRTDLILSLKTILSKHVSCTSRGKVFGCLIDFKKACDTVQYEGLLKKHNVLNIKGSFLEIIKDMYFKSLCAMNLNNSRTRFFRCKRGMHQNCTLSPMLPNVYTNDLLFDLDKENPDPVLINSCCMAYADDILIRAKSAVALQRMLDIAGSFCDRWNS